MNEKTLAEKIMEVGISVTNYGKDRTLLTTLNAQIILDIPVKTLEFLAHKAYLEQEMEKGNFDPDEGFSKPMGPWGKEEGA